MRRSTSGEVKDVEGQHHPLVALELAQGKIAFAYGRQLEVRRNFANFCWHYSPLKYRFAWLPTTGTSPDYTPLAGCGLTLFSLFPGQSHYGPIAPLRRCWCRFIDNRPWTACMAHAYPCRYRQGESLGNSRSPPPVSGHPNWEARGLLPLICVGPPKCNEILWPDGPIWSDLAGNLESSQLQSRPLPGIIGSKQSDRKLCKTDQNSSQSKTVTAPGIPADPFHNSIALRLFPAYFATTQSFFLSMSRKSHPGESHSPQSLEARYEEALKMGLRAPDADRHLFSIESERSHHPWAATFSSGPVP